MSDPASKASEPPHIYRWDLDKTYLRTDFDTLRDLVRTAIERPDPTAMSSPKAVAKASSSRSSPSAKSRTKPRGMAG